MNPTRRQFLHTSAVLALSSTAGFAADPASPDRRLRIGQIGTRHGHAAGKMATLRRLKDHFEVVALAGAEETPGDAYAGLPRLEMAELLALPGLEAVLVETDFPDACAAAHAAIKAGKHVHLDKPGALDHAAFRAMRREAEDRGLIFQMGYMLRYNPAFQLLAEAVPGGWLGRITEIDAMMGKKLDEAGRLDLLRLEGGGMFELGCHLVDAVCGLMGKPTAVQAFSKPTGTDGFKDNQLALLEFPGAMATLRCNMADPFGGPRRRFLITGTEGSMEIMPLESGQITARFTTSRGPYPKGTQQISLPVPSGRYDAELTAFAEAIRQGKSLPWDAAHDIAVHETALQAGGVKS
jgi:predicted dehydrogenase